MRHVLLIFAVGAVCGLAIAAALNVLPYWRSYQAYTGDGFEVAGFPFTFHRVGGCAYIVEFRVDLLLLNVALAVAFASVMGWVAVRIFRVLCSTGHGFPVGPPSPERPAAK